MTDDEDDGPLLFSDDEIEFGNEPRDPNPRGPRRFLNLWGHEVRVTDKQYAQLLWWLECSETIRA